MIRRKHRPQSWDLRPIEEPNCDPLGSYTGKPTDPDDQPTQDADDI